MPLLSLVFNAPATDLALLLAHHLATRGTSAVVFRVEDPPGPFTPRHLTAAMFAPVRLGAYGLPAESLPSAVLAARQAGVNYIITVLPAAQDGEMLDTSDLSRALISFKRFQRPDREVLADLLAWTDLAARHQPLLFLRLLDDDAVRILV